MEQDKYFEDMIGFGGGENRASNYCPPRIYYVVTARYLELREQVS